MARGDLRAIAELAAGLGVDAWLVGGALRDLFLGRAVNDLDFALSGACEELPRAFAERIAGTSFWLDEVRQQARVTKKQDDGTAVYDLAPLCGTTIQEDLARRDFTINALAVTLSGDRRELIDPLHGCDDLRQGIVRVCGAAAFDDDPLRLLRAIRFSVELGFTIEESTWEAIRRRAGLLKGVAAERVRDELCKTLAATGCGASLRKLVAAGLWREIAPFPGPSPNEMDIDRADAAERLCMEMGDRFMDERKRLADYLGHEVEGGISVLPLVKLAAFLGSDEEEKAAVLAERLRLGREARRMLGFLCRDEAALHGDPARVRAVRAMYRFFRDREPAGPGMLVISRAAGAVSEDVFRRLVQFWLRDYDPDVPDLFLSGGEIMEILGITPGKTVGQAMAQLREAESVGIVNSREEAREFVKNLLTKEEAMR